MKKGIIIGLLSLGVVGGSLVAYSQIGNKTPEACCDPATCCPETPDCCAFEDCR